MAFSVKWLPPAPGILAAMRHVAINAHDTYAPQPIVRCYAGWGVGVARDSRVALDYAD